MIQPSTHGGMASSSLESDSHITRHRLKPKNVPPTSQEFVFDSVARFARDRQLIDVSVFGV
ncbi:hypothetical protein Heshes_07190 [Alicyclobacillus hesperidum]|uniref:Uncharacterized protein n=1 Tax=Alicyclobacillus hesperidum TaxID=89784 RepID=A0AA37U411_9BACL|nr:hypothetical protein Heshes_07190 [Alicyclobacillus hesperidum]